MPLASYHEAFVASLKEHAGGAIVSFTGIVREDERGGASTVNVHIECIEEMATTALNSIAATLEAREGVERVFIVHFTGDFQPGEPMVHVLACGVHRHEAFKALQDAVEMYKHGAPLWKKETYDDGSSSWKE